MSKKQVTKEQKQTIKRVSKVLLGIARGSAQTSPEIAYAGFMGCLHILKTAGVINGFKELTLRTQDNGNRKVNFRILYPWNSGKGKNNPTDWSSSPVTASRNSCAARLLSSGSCQVANFCKCD